MIHAGKFAATRSVAIVLAFNLIAWTPGCAAAQSEHEGGTVTETALAPPPTGARTSAGPLYGAALRGVIDANIRTTEQPPRRHVVSDDVKSAVADEIAVIRARPSIEGHTLSALVIDAESGDVIFEHEPDALVKPASNTKMFTTAAAFGLLGDDYRIVTRVYADGEPDKKGKVANVYLVGNHDFTWSDEFYNHSSVPLERLADDLSAAGIKRIDKLWAHGEFVFNGFRYDEYKPEKHRSEAAKAFRAALEKKGIVVRERDVSEHFDPPEGAIEVATWQSVPLHVACTPINRLSHNEFADALSRHIGFVVSQESTYEAGTKASIAWMAEAGIDTEGMAFNDGSGLSHDNRVSARQVVSLIAYMHTQPFGVDWNRTMSIAGVDGTYKGRMTWPETRGRVFAKSGTLDGVIATSGYLVNAFDGRTYLFSIMMNEVDSRKGGRVAQNLIVQTFAGDMLGLGSRPAPPTLHAVEHLPGSPAIRVEWDGVEDATMYRVWRSSDGRVWDPADSLWVSDPQVVLRDLEQGSQHFIRLSAVNDAGESELSDTYGATVGSGPRVLLVDGNDRWDAAEDENPLGAGHDFVVSWGQALASVEFDTCANEAVASGRCELGDYDAVFWALGEESGESEALDLDEQATIKDFLSGGGNLWLSGAELGFDLCSAEHDQAGFYRDVLRTEHAGDDAQTYLVEGAGGIFADLELMGFFTPGAMDVSVPDRLQPANGASTCLRYVGGRGGVAAVQYDGEYKLLNFGFPLEAIDNRIDRRAIVSAALIFFGVTPAT